MRAFWVLTRLRMMEILRVPSTLSFFFGMPLMMLLLTALLFAKGQPYQRCRIDRVGFAPGSPSLLAPNKAAAVWADRPREQAMARLLSSQVQAVMLAEQPVRILVTPGQQLLGEGLRAQLPGAVLEVVAPRPWGFVHYLSPGILAFALIISGLFGLGYSLARYRQTHFLRKLATTPLSRTSFIASQIVGRGLLVLLQCSLLLATMKLVFAMSISPLQALAALGVSLAGLLVFLGLGFVLACLVHQEALLSDAINAVSWPLLLVSEIFFPCDALPGPLPTLAGWLPSTQLVRLLRDVLCHGVLDVASLAPGLSILLGWGVVSLGLGWWLFRWTDRG